MGNGLGSGSSRLLKQIIESMLVGKFDLSSTLKIILNGSRDLSNAEYVQIMLREGIDEYLVVRATTLPQELDQQFLAANWVYGDQVVLDGETVNVHNFDAYRHSESSEPHSWLHGFNSNVSSGLFVPLKESDQVIGVICMGSPRIDAFTDYDQSLLEILAGQTTVAIRVSRYRKQHEALHKIDKFIQNTELELDKKLEAFLNISLDLIDTDFGILWLRQGEKHLVARATTSKLREAVLGKQLSIDNSLTGRALKKAEIHIVPDVSQEDRYKPILQDELMHSEIDVPLINEEQVIGVLNIESPRYDAFDSQTVELLKTIAGQGAILINNASTDKIRQIETEVKEYLISGNFSPRELYKNILDRARYLVHASHAQFLLVYPEGLIIEASTTGIAKPGTRLPFDVSFCGEYIVNKALPFWISPNLLEEEFYWGNLTDEDGNRMLSELAVAIKSGDDLLGVLNFESSVEDAFSKQDAEVILNLANGIAIAIKRGIDREFENNLGYIIGELAEGDIPIEMWLENVIHRTSDLMHVSEVQLMRVEGEDLVSVAATGDSGYHAVVKIKDSISGLAVLDEKPIRIDQMSSYEKKERFKGEWMESELAVPLVHSGYVVGVINVEAKRPHAFTARHEEMLQEFARTIALGYHLREMEQHQTRLFHNTKGRLAYIRTMSKDCQEDIAEGKAIRIEWLKEIEEKAYALYTVADRITRRANMHPFSPVALLDRFRQTIRFPEHLHHANHSLAISDNLTEYPVVVGDRNMLVDTLTLLVENSIYAMGEIDRDTHELAFEIDEADNNQIEIVVGDTGNGVPEHIKPTLFEGHSTKGVFGSGIGLPDALFMMRKMLGRITLRYSEAGEGTKMSLFLPRARLVAILTNPRIEYGTDNPLNVYLFSTNSKLCDLCIRVTSGEWLNLAATADYSEPDGAVLQNIELEPSLLIIDFSTDPQAGLAFFEHLEHSSNVNPERDLYQVHYFNSLPTSVDEFTRLIKDAVRDVPKGHL